MNSLTTRKLVRVIRGMPATDGAGVELTRVIGQPALPMLDPFLLLDAFRSDNPEDYIAGFPEHPHRGFETVTYLLNGRMRHKDNAGHEGVIEAGGVQWMTAGRGIVHSEMPEQKDGLLAGFQLWVNLPATHKMDAPAYQEYSADRIPVEQRDGGLSVKVIAGATSQGTIGPVVQRFAEPVYLDIAIPAGGEFIEPLSASHNVFACVIDGEIGMLHESGKPATLQHDQLGVIGSGDVVVLTAGSEGARLLLIAGKPLNEPVARGGPFVMNTRDEVQQAFEDYNHRRL